MKMQNKKRSGFTLVELLVVIAILAILATVSVVGYTAFIKKAHISNAETEAAQIKEMITANVLAGQAYDLGKATVKSSSTSATESSQEIYAISSGASYVLAVLEKNSYVTVASLASSPTYDPCADFDEVLSSTGGVTRTISIDDLNSIDYIYTCSSVTVTITISFNPNVDNVTVTK